MADGLMVISRLINIHTVFQFGTYPSLSVLGFAANFCNTTGYHSNKRKILQRAEIFKQLFPVNDGRRKSERASGSLTRI